MMRKNRSLQLVLAAFCVSAAWAGSAEGVSIASQREEGKQVFAMNCSVGYCHGLEGAPAKDRGFAIAFGPEAIFTRQFRMAFRIPRCRRGRAGSRIGASMPWLLIFSASVANSPTRELLMPAKNPFHQSSLSAKKPR